MDGGWWTPGQLNCFKDDGMIRKLLKRFLNRGDPGDKPGLGVIMLRSDQTCNIYANIQFDMRMIPPPLCQEYIVCTT